MIKSDYMHIEFQGKNFIKDLNLGNRSVTNNADQILDELKIESFTYQDSCGDWAYFDGSFSFKKESDIPQEVLNYFNS